IEIIRGTTTKENLNFFDIDGAGRSICLAFPKHFCSSRVFMDFVGKCRSTLRQQYDLTRQEALLELDLIVIK
ncbi:MAG: hypothetical protein OSB34_12720, partial [Planktomarina sp.]|nr:hypothetical protein [Planktomarina sp.]